MKCILYTLYITHFKNTKYFLLHAVWYEDRAIQLLKFSMSQEVKEGPFAALTFDSSKIFILTYFRKLMWFYSLATKDSLLGKVWGKCPGPLLQRSPLNFYIFLKRKKNRRPGKKLLLILPFIFFSEGTVTTLLSELPSTSLPSLPFFINV